MTLVEVIAALVILGTILAALAMARGRFARQWAEADRKLTATKALDSLIVGWTEGIGAAVPINQQGNVPTMRSGIWRTRVLRNTDAAKLAAVVVRVEVFDRVEVEKSGAVPLVSVDLLVHLPPKRAATNLPPGELIGDQRRTE